MVEVPQDTVTFLLTSLEAVTPARAQRSAACFILSAILNKIARTTNVSRCRWGWQGRAGCRGAVLNGRVRALKPKPWKRVLDLPTTTDTSPLHSDSLDDGVSDFYGFTSPHPRALLVQLLNRCSVAVLRFTLFTLLPTPFLFHFCFCLQNFTKDP